MTKNVKRFFSMMLALSMVFSLALPAAATETEAHDHAEEVVQETTAATEAAAETTEVPADITVDTDEEDIKVEVSKLDLDIQFNSAMVMSSEDVQVDRNDPVIIALEAELKSITVLDEEGNSVALTEDQINTVLYLYSEYQKHWAANADVLGVQTPFFLSYNDNKDGLGILGEMLVLANKTVDQVRSGEYSYDDLVGMIQNFTYADVLGVQYYGGDIKNARDEVLGLIENSGAQTEAQKLLVLNDWLAHINTFDMPYIMNNGKAEDEKPMVAENPQPHEHYQDVYNVIYADYEDQLEQTFRQNIRGGLEAEFKVQYYTPAIETVYNDMMVAYGVSEAAKDEAVVEAAKQAYWQEVYDEAVENIDEQAIYDEAYEKAFNDYLDKNCEGGHKFEGEFTFTEELDAEGKATGTYTAVAAEVTCQVCGRIHENVEGTVTTETRDATCEEPLKKVLVATATIKDDYNEYTISGEKILLTEGEALGHDWDDGVVTKEATETETGIMTYTCSVCEATKEETIPVKEHEHTYETVVTAPTCMEDGYTTYTCACGDTYTGDKVTAPGHKAVAYEEVAATCTTVGYTGGKYCSVCTQVLENRTKIGALGHDFSNGTGMCSRCTTVESECEHPTNKVVHENVSWYTTDENGETMPEGYRVTATYTCESCGVIHGSVPATDIAVVEDTTKSKAATCTEDAVKWYDATISFGEGESFSEPNTRTIAGTATGHTYVDGECACGAKDPEYTAPETPAAVSEVVNAEEEQETLYADNLTIREEADAVAKESAEKAVEEGVEQAAKNEADEAVAALTEEEVQAKAEAVVRADEEAMAAIETQAEAATEEYMTTNADAIKADPVGFVDNEPLFQTQVPVTDADGNYIIGDDGQPVMMTIAAQLHAGWDSFWADAQENGVEVDPVNAPGHKMTVDQIVDQQMGTPQKDDMLMKLDQNGQPVLDEEGNPTYMTPNEAIPVYADQAAKGLTDGVINYWEGSQFGALGFGTSVCLGYTKAFTYLVQCMHPEVYLKDGATDITVAENWKTAQDLYYDAEGNLDINQNYVVDAVRVTFMARVTMFGQTEDNFNSDHFWNAVKVDGEWYYVDPCYTDVFTEVMMRDRVETDGQMNHLYFMFSDTSARELYDGNMKEIKTLYEGVAINEQYETSWMSRIKSNTYFADGYAYYMYDSTDMLALMEEYEDQNTEADIEDPLYKIVRHKLDTTDAGDGDEDYETLITFNYTEDDDSEAVATVYDPETKGTVDNELLTELWHKHAEYAEIYPSIMINAALYNGKIYFNLANCILSYDIATSEVAVVKEYNTVYGVRDDTNPFGGMAFTTVSSADGADFTVENRPIAGMTIKNDGNMYVSVATNFAFISGKEERTDPASAGYGYAFEESNYNNDYNSYMDYGDMDDDELESYGYTKEINDNDEFMWTANFVEKLSMSHLTGSHTYASVAVSATCGIDAYTENRCSECGAVEADTRVYEEGTALEHHYVEFAETFYTKDDAGRWNTGVCYVCTVCGNAVTEPVEPKGQAATDEAMAEYEEALAIFEAAKESAGHTYVPTGEVWAEDNSTVTFRAVECSSVCPERKPYLDCLLEDNTISLTLDEEVTAEATVSVEGTCPEGVTLVYTASGEAETADGAVVKFTATTKEQRDPAECNFVDCICTVCGDCSVKRVYGDDRYATAFAIADTMKEVMGVEKFESVVIGYSENFPDALAGSYLAAVANAPILLTKDKESRLTPVKDYINENLVEGGKVYILGSEGVIPESLVTDLSNAGFDVQRLAGKDRYETNLEVLKVAMELDTDKTKPILVATGRDFADSLSASAAGMPVLLVRGDKTLSDAQKVFLEANADRARYVIGSEGVVSASMYEAVGATKRLAGDDRYLTSVAVANELIKEADSVVLAYASTFPDGLCGGPLAYQMGASLILTKARHEDIAADYVAENAITMGYVLGSNSLVTDNDVTTIFAMESDIVIPAKQAK